MKIAFFEIRENDSQHFTKALKGHELSFFKESLNLNNWSGAKGCEIISVSTKSRINSEMLSKLPKLKYIATRSTGFDHIDGPTCKKRSIKVSNVPDYGEHTVAEHTFGLILNLSRNIHKSYRRTLHGNFSIEGLQGFDLENKTIGIIGGGRIGLHAAKIAKGFGMQVLVSDPHQDGFLSEIIGFSYCTLEELLKKSDIISLHAPESPATHHLINQDSIKLIKKGALLINTARGGLVDTDALIKALDKKIIIGAGLDVIEGEELIREEKQLLHISPDKLTLLMKDHEIFKRDNVIFTPHIAFYSKEALDKIIKTSINNILAFSNGKHNNPVLI
jgi:D-lactate dehydrogenase